MAKRTWWQSSANIVPLSIVSCLFRFALKSNGHCLVQCHYKMTPTKLRTIKNVMQLQMFGNCESRKRIAGIAQYKPKQLLLLEAQVSESS